MASHGSRAPRGGGGGGEGGGGEGGALEHQATSVGLRLCTRIPLGPAALELIWEFNPSMLCTDWPAFSIGLRCFVLAGCWKCMLHSTERTLVGRPLQVPLQLSGSPAGLF